MQLIFDNIYIILIAAGAIASWVKSQSDAKAERVLEENRRRAVRDQTNKDHEFVGEDDLPEPRYPRQTSAPAVPPALPQPTTSRSRKTPAANTAKLPDFSAELTRQQRLLDQVNELKRAKQVQQEARKAPEQSFANNTKTSSTKGLFARLHDRSEVRQAFVLKEILERPVGLR